MFYIFLIYLFFIYKKVIPIPLMQAWHIYRMLSAGRINGEKNGHATSIGYRTPHQA
jgi:hypothetical protein